MNVAVCSAQHSEMFEHPALSQTVTEGERSRQSLRLAVAQTEVGTNPHPFGAARSRVFDRDADAGLEPGEADLAGARGAWSGGSAWERGGRFAATPLAQVLNDCVTELGLEARDDRFTDVTHRWRTVEHAPPR